MFLTGGVGYAIALRFGVYEQPVREMRVAGIRGVASALRAWRRQRQDVTHAGRVAFSRGGCS